eukprot:1195393-Prorocentrum_minimum.AAC.4
MNIPGGKAGFDGGLGGGIGGEGGAIGEGGGVGGLLGGWLKGGFGGWCGGGGAGAWRARISARSASVSPTYATPLGTIGTTRSLGGGGTCCFIVTMREIASAFSMRLAASSSRMLAVFCAPVTGMHTTIRAQIKAHANDAAFIVKSMCRAFRKWRIPTTQSGYPPSP